MTPAAIAALRVDIWLWRARFFKTRSLAAKAVSAGTIRIDRNGAPARLDKPSALVRPGDVLSFARSDGLVRVVEVTAFGERRGPASEAMTLYVDRTPAAAPARSEPSLAERKGRPTKKDRRALDRFMGDEDA
jgi:ribosome-associated heat shock protein Hsp15